MLRTFVELPWHAIPADEVARSLETNNTTGLTSEEARERAQFFGPNRIMRAVHWRWARIVLRQFESPLVLLLMAAGVVVWYLHAVSDAVMIGLVIILNAMIGIYQEGRASRAFEKLREGIKSTAYVIRDGKLISISTEDIVPGDILDIRAGMAIAADARLIGTQTISVNESALTGEWIPQIKNVGILHTHANLLDRTNMVYASTLCESGTARAIVVDTGNRTELGRIASLVATTEETSTPLQNQIKLLTRSIGIGVFVVSAILFALGILRGESSETMFFLAVAIAVSAIPEGLPIAVTVILAIGAERILQRGGLLKELKSAETLGSATVIITDKTGTLTEGVMSVSHVIPAVVTDEGRIDLLTCAAVASDAFIENPGDDLEEWKMHGQPTSRALLLASMSAGITKEDVEKKMSLVRFTPFDTAVRVASAIYKDARSYHIFVTGAPEEVLNRSKLSAADRKRHEDEYRVLAEQGARIVAGARVTLPHEPEEFDGLTFLGFIAFHDPLRADAKELLESARRAGIRTIIATGDHPETARRIARELGISPNPIVIEGKELENGNEINTDADVYARVLPSHKFMLVEALKRRGEIIAMTGDGINDAPALKRADIGVALGSGTEVAKEASDLVLLNNSFSTIISAIEEGRTIIDNLRKVITFLLATGFTEIILIAGTLVLGLPMPFLPGQILWMNFIGEGFFNFAFAFEKREHDILDGRPPSIHGLFSREMRTLIFAVGITTSIILFALYTALIAVGTSLEQARTVMFLGIAVQAFFFAFALRSLRRSIWNIDFFSNPHLLFAIGAGMLFLVPVFFFKPLGTLLHVVPISWGHGVLVLSVGLISLLAIEMTKYHFIARGEAR